MVVKLVNALHWYHATNRPLPGAQDVSATGLALIFNFILLIMLADFYFHFIL
jgi:hypothetical protein